LLAILCLMRYEDWTFREAEVCLAEHRELRQALGLASVPDFTDVPVFLDHRVSDSAFDQLIAKNYDVPTALHCWKIFLHSWIEVLVHRSFSTSGPRILLQQINASIGRTLWMFSEIWEGILRQQAVSVWQR
jgi:hypothetical protein